VLGDRVEAGLVVVKIFLELAALDVKDVDEHSNVAEDVWSLARKIIFHKRLLPAPPQQRLQNAVSVE
jgi:hypothetical protein